MLPHEEDFDHDIADMELSREEKAGLQVFRNYTRSFEEHALAMFKQELSAEDLDLSALGRLLDLIKSEDFRFLPVIVCGYADEMLMSAFQKTIPIDVPGGTRQMLSGYGPLADLSKRIRMAFAFDVLSRDLMLELDRVRKIRNRLSHDWNMKAVEELLCDSHLKDLHPIEIMLSDRGAIPRDLNLETIIRIRLIWLAGRLTYEEAAYNRAKVARLSPSDALYGEGGTAWLKAVSEVCMKATWNVGTPG